MTSKFYTATGDLTAYGLACGYIEVRQNGDDRAILEREHNVYHVKALIGGTRIWETFDSLTAARTFFKKLARANNL